MKEKLLLAAAALLGFATACNNEEDQPKTVCMYGIPYNNYKIKGKVTDKAGRPIKGIEVRSNAYLPTPEATTAADGTYDLSGKGAGNTARVTFPGQRRRLRRKDRRHRIHRGRTHGQRRRRLGSRGIRQIGRRHRPRGEGVAPAPDQHVSRDGKTHPANAQTSLALRPAFTIFTEHRMRLGNAQTSLALRSTFTIFAGWIHSITTSNS